MGKSLKEIIRERKSDATVNIDMTLLTHVGTYITNVYIYYTCTYIYKIIYICIFAYIRIETCIIFIYIYIYYDFVNNIKCNYSHNTIIRDVIKYYNDLLLYWIGRRARYIQSVLALSKNISPIDSLNFNSIFFN